MHMAIVKYLSPVVTELDEPRLGLRLPPHLAPSVAMQMRDMMMRSAVDRRDHPRLPYMRPSITSRLQSSVV